jgi:hypothetical protein
VTNTGFHNDLFFNAASRSDVKVVSCTSRGAKLFRTELAAFMGWPSRISIDSWTFEEYKAAFKAGLPVFKTKYKSLDGLEEAYFYSGGSVRFMCLDTESVISQIDDMIMSVSDVSLLLRGLEGDQASGSVNFLMQIFDGKSGPLSQYVCKKLARKVDDAFILAAENVNVNNPAWQGWVFEMKVINLIQKGRDPFSIINSTDGSSISWSTIYEGAREAVFDPLIYTDKSEPTGLGKRMGRNIWYFPVRFNQGGYDFLFIDENRVIFFFQVTKATTHKYNFKLLVPSLDLLCEKDGAAQIHYCVLIPNKNKAIFKIAPGNIVDADVVSVYDLC